VILDVGANVGKYSALARSLNQDVRIYAFEPHPVTYAVLEQTATSLNFTSINAAVGSEDGEITLYDYASNDGSSHASMYAGVIEGIHKGGKPVSHKCPILSLDGFCKERDIDEVRLLKIDVEGHEMAVLQGASRLITNKRVKMLHFEFNEMNIESRTYFKDFWDFLAADYDIYRMLPDGLVPIRNYSPVYCEIFAYQNIVALLRK